MKCPNCAAQVPDEQSFCGNCGTRVTPVTLEAISKRLSTVESQLTLANGKEQKFLEQETAVNIVNRLTKWSTLFLYWVAIPATLIVVLLGIIVGTGEFNLKKIVTNASTEVNDFVAKQRDQIAETKKTSAEALNTAKQMNAETAKGKQEVESLRQQVKERSSDVENLKATIKSSDDRVASLERSVQDQKRQVAQLEQRQQRVETNKQVAEVVNEYPTLYGEVHAYSQSGALDAKNKKPGEIYTIFLLALNPTTGKTVQPEHVVTINNALSAAHFSVFRGPAGLTRGPGRFDYSSCRNRWTDMAGVRQFPCILYFDRALKDKALEAGRVISNTFPMPEKKIVYIDPATMPESTQNLVKMSGIDLVIVVGTPDPGVEDY